jgi:Guanine nucleotide exchange factor in Golgi transport N-terminal
MIVIDSVVEEDRCMLLANELGPITLPNETTKELSPTAQDTFAIFGDPRLLGNGERPQFLPHGCLHKTFDLELIESVLTNYLEPFRKVCLSSASPIRDLYASSHPQILLLFTAFRGLTLITTPPLPSAPQNERSAFLLAPGGTRIVFLLLKQFSSELKTDAEVILTLLIKLIGGETDSLAPLLGCSRWRSCAGKAPLYT